jgi:hypothetical protein
MSEISRDPADLVAQTRGAHHQYPDGFVLYCGTMFAPVQDRDALGAGFTHHMGDVVTIQADGGGWFKGYARSAPRRVASGRGGEGWTLSLESAWGKLQRTTYMQPWAVDGGSELLSIVNVGTDSDGSWQTVNQAISAVLAYAGVSGTVGTITFADVREHLSLSSPPDEDFNSERKTEISRRQLMDHLAGREIKCAKCSLVRAMHSFYRCRFCSVWYCPKCADAHFGNGQHPTSPAPVPAAPAPHPIPPGSRTA